MVTWLRAPAFSPNALVLSEREGRAARLFARLSLPPLAFVVMAALTIALFVFTPLYAQNSGMGDDGMNYSAWARAWDGTLKGLRAIGLNSYSVQRVLPMVIVRLVMDALKMPMIDNRGILRVFQVMDTACVIAALGSIALATRHLRLSRAGFLVAMIGTSFNFATMYWLPFDPVLTDAMALLVGAASLWAYLSRRYAVLAAITIAGGFVWPSAAQTGMLLLFFPRRLAGAEPAPPDDPAHDLEDAPSMLDTAVAALLAAIIGYASFRLAGLPQMWKEHAPHPSLLRLSCALLAVYAFAGMRSLLRIKATLREVLRFDAETLMSRALAIAVWLVVGAGTKWLSAKATTVLPQAPPAGMTDFFQGLMVRAVARPLGFLWAHVGFYGPFVVLMVVFWPRVCAASRRLGFAFDAVLALTLLFSFNTESRGMIALAPLVLPLAVVACARMPWTPRRLLELGALTFLASKLWYAPVQKPTIDWETIFVHIGPWMGNDAMFLHAVGFVLIAVWSIRLLRSSPAPEQTVWLSEAQP